MKEMCIPLNIVVLWWAKLRTNVLNEVGVSAALYVEVYKCFDPSQSADQTN